MPCQNACPQARLLSVKVHTSLNAIQFDFKRIAGSRIDIVFGNSAYRKEENPESRYYSLPKLFVKTIQKQL